MKSKMLGLMAVLSLMGPMAAQSVIVTISGQGATDGQWDVTYSKGSFDDDHFRFAIESQVWWGNATLAEAFEDAVNSKLGAPLSGQLGPLFAWGLEGGTGPVIAEVWRPVPGEVPYSADTADSDPYASAVRVSPAPEPATLLLLGLGVAGLGFMRRRRAR